MRKSSGAEESILVLPAGLRAGPWACRSLAAGGYRVVAAHERGDSPLIARTRHADRFLYYPSPSHRPNDFLEWIETVCREDSVAAVLPLSESTLHLLVSSLPEPGSALLIGPTSEQYDQVCDKEGLIATARSVGVETPPGTIVDESARGGEWPPLPSIVKPRASATPTSSGVVYQPAKLVETTAERERAVAALLEASGGALVQEVVRGERFRVHFVRHRGGLVASAQKTVRSFPIHTGMCSVSLGVELSADLQTSTESVVEEIGYYGPGSTQFIRRNGCLYLHDVNLRLEYSVGASMLAGLDSPRLCVDDALGRPVSIARAPEPGRHYVWLSGEARALVDGLRGRPTAAPRGKIARDLLLAALSPRRVLDPFQLSDPLPTVGGLLLGIRKLRRVETPS